MIAARRDEQSAVGAEHNGPALVSFGRMTWQTEQFPARGGIPDLDLADFLESRRIADRCDPSTVRAEGHAHRYVMMTPACEQSSAGRGVQEVHRPLMPDGGQGLAIRAE